MNCLTFQSTVTYLEDKMSDCIMELFHLVYDHILLPLALTNSQLFHL